MKQDSAHWTSRQYYAGIGAALVSRDVIRALGAAAERRPAWWERFFEWLKNDAIL